MLENSVVQGFFRARAAGVNLDLADALVYRNSGRNRIWVNMQIKRKKFPVWSRVIFIALILLTASAIGFSAWKKWSVDPAENTGRTGAEGQKEQNANSDDAGEKVNAVEFPYKLEEGKISIDSVFQFTGFNPDNENMEGENIAALTVVNQSEQHLTFAQFTSEAGGRRGACL